MKRHYLLIIFLTAYSYIYACSSFVFKNNEQFYLCANFDDYTLYGYVIQNKRNVLKTSFNPFVDKKLKWTSKFGSITFTNIGRELPLGGINEAGLAITIMQTPKIKYPALDNRYELNEINWIQYVLDNFSSIQEVINSDSLVRINGYFDNVHYLICDKTGKSLIVEYNDGKMNCYTGENVTIPVLENSFYEKSVKQYKQEKENYVLNSRFSRLAYHLENRDKSLECKPQDMFPILENAKQSITKWQIVYDIKNLQIYYRTATFNYLAVKGSKDYVHGLTEVTKIELNKFDFLNGPLASTIGIIDKSLIFQPYNKVFDIKIMDANIETYLKKRKTLNIEDRFKQEYLKYVESIN
jgi:choloylglycine hydrolase